MGGNFQFKYSVIWESIPVLMTGAKLTILITFFGLLFGFFLEQHREPLMVEEKHLKPLNDLRPRQPHYLDRDQRKSGHLVSEWNLVVPREVFERTWAEVL